MELKNAVVLKMRQELCFVGQIYSSCMKRFALLNMYFLRLTQLDLHSACGLRDLTLHVLLERG